MGSGLDHETIYRKKLTDLSFLSLPHKIFKSSSLVLKIQIDHMEYFSLEGSTWLFQTGAYKVSWMKIICICWYRNYMSFCIKKQMWDD